MIERLKFKNFCNFREAEFAFTPGVNVIVGPNGSGKSTILNGIAGLLAGDFSRTGRGKQPAENSVHAHATGEKDRCGVEGTFTVPAGRWTVERNIKPSSRKIVLHDNRTLRKDGEIAECLKGAWGVSQEVLLKYVIVEQLALCDIVTMGAQDRLKAIAAAFQLEHYERVWDALDKETKLDRQVLAEPRPDVDQLAAAREAADREWQALELQPAPAPPIGINEGLLQGAVDLFRRRGELAEALRQAAEWRRKCQNAHHAAVTMHDNTQADYNARRQKQHGAAAEIAEWREQLRLWDEWSGTQTLVGNLLGRVETLRRQLADSQPPPAPGTAEDRATLVDDAQKHQVQANALWPRVQLIRELRQAGKAMCKTCGQSVSSILGDADSERIYEESFQAAERLSLALQPYLKHDADLASWKKGQANLAGQLQKAEQDLQQQGGGNTARPEALWIEHDLVQTFRDAVGQFDRESLDLNRLSDTLVTMAKAVVTAAADEAEAQQKEVKAMAAHAEVPTEGSYHAAVRMLDEAQKARTALAVHEEKLRSARRRVDDAAAALAAAADYLEQRRSREEWVRRADLLRPAFHRDGVPKKVLARRMQQLQALVAGFLRHFAVAFTPEWTDDMDVLCRFHDGKVLPASRLSVGQTSALALSMRLAIHRAVAPGVDFLCLDEPAAGLDKANRTALNRMLTTAMRSIAASENVQFVVVTHDDFPEGAVDNVIRLQA